MSNTGSAQPATRRACDERHPWARRGRRAVSWVIAGALAVPGCMLNTEGEGAIAGASFGGSTADASQDPADELAAGAGGSAGASGLGGWGGGGTGGFADASIDVDAGGQSGDAGEDAADGAIDAQPDIIGDEPSCGLGLTECGSACVDIQSNIGHCGGCDKVCTGANATCNGGSCGCAPKCVSANGCGDDGCGGSCGGCVASWSCWQGYCVKEWATSGAWNCHQKCGGNTAANPSLTCVGSDTGSCDDHETMCYCWCAEQGTCSL